MEDAMRAGSAMWDGAAGSGGNGGPGVVYAPTILRSMAEICDAFGVGVKRVRSWAESGAPIVVEGEGAKRRYSAEAAELHAWRVMESRGRPI